MCGFQELSLELDFSTLSVSDLSRFDNGEFKLVLTNLRVQDAVHKSLKLLEPLVRSQGIRMVISCEGASPRCWLLLDF